MKSGQWYPGNMARAVEILKEDIKIVDLVVELLDARIPISSRNPSLNNLAVNKNRLILLHKADRADQQATDKWLSKFIGEDIMALPFSVYEKSHLDRFLKYLKDEEKTVRKGRIKRPLRMIIVGIPNVGKSTLINYFVKKSVVRTGNQPGITRGRQWIRINPELELLDTPGVLWPKIDEETIWPLAIVGALPAGRVDRYETAIRLLKYFEEQELLVRLGKKYPGLVSEEPQRQLEYIGKALGCFLTGGEIDYERAAAALLRDFQSGQFGRITLELPEECSRV